MSLNVWDVKTREDFLRIQSIDLTQFELNYANRPNLPRQYQDSLSKTDDVILPISDFFALRVLTNLQAPYQIHGPTDLVLLEGSCTSENVQLVAHQTDWPWLKSVHSTVSGKKNYNAGDVISLTSGALAYQVLTAQTVCVLGQWNYQTSPGFHHSGNCLFESMTLSDQGRKLIKLSKNIYAQDGRRDEEELRVKFFHLLGQMNEQDLLLIYLTQAYLVLKPQVADFRIFMNQNHRGLLKIVEGILE